MCGRALRLLFKRVNNIQIEFLNLIQIGHECCNETLQFCGPIGEGYLQSMTYIKR